MNRRAFASCVLAIAVFAPTAPVLAQVPAAAPSTGAHKLTRPPRLATFVEAPFPETERAAGHGATVVLELGITATGTVDNVAVAQSAGAAFDQAAADAARAFVFEPAEVDGKPAAIRILYRYEFVLKEEAPTTAILEGQIREQRSKRPLAGLQVAVAGASKVTTDADGRFRLDALPPGPCVVSLSGAGLSNVETSETLEAGRQTTVTYDVELQESKPAEDRDDLEIVVAPPPMEKQVVSTQVAAEEARRVPGTQGDVLKVVENLPGVARASVGSGQLVVWGAAPEDTHVYVDDVPVPTLYHQGGFRSVVHSDMVKSVELMPGGWGPEYGRGIGGLVKVDLGPIAKDGVHGSVSSDLLDSAADVHARFGDRVAVEVAGRKSYLDALLPAFTSSNVGQYVPIPRYYDAQTRVTWEPSKSARIELGAMISSDTVSDEVPSIDPTNVQTQTHDTGFRRVWLRFVKQTADGAEMVVVPSLGTNTDSLVDAFGPVPTRLEVDATVASLRAGWRKRVAGGITLTAGVDGQLTESHFRRTGSTTSPPRQGDDYVFGQAPPNQVAHDDGTVIVSSVAPYAAADLALADGRIHVVPGVRLDPYLLTTNRRYPPFGTTPAHGLASESTGVEPRLSVRWTPVPALTWKAGWGQYHEPPAPSDLSAVFGNPTLGLESAEHVLAGVAVGTPDVLSFEATVFHATSQNLAVRSSLPTPLAAQALVATGVGRSRGVQILVRKQLARRFFGWVTYTLSQSQRAFAPGAPYYDYGFDQTYVLSAVASLDLGHGFEIGGRFRYATGYPRTPVTGSYFDGKTGTFEPIFGPLNSIRVPDFVQLDVRLSKRFVLGDANVEAYLDVQNVTNRANPEEIVYALDYSQRRYITGLPILPVAGARVSW